MNINPKQIKELRTQTGAGVMTIKKVLAEAEGDLAKAKKLLREKGEEVAAEKAERQAAQGVVEAYVHSNGKVGCLLVLACETDFVARNPEFKELAKDIAMHITAMDPKFVSPDDVTEDFLKEERQIAEKQAAAEKKPEEVQKKIVEGKLEKVKAEAALLSQTFIKDEEKTVADLIKEKVAKLGENIQVREFTRFEI